MNIPKELIKETVNGYHILRTDIPYIFDEPIECIIEGKNEMLYAIIPNRLFPIITNDNSYILNLPFRVKVEKELRPMNQIEMANYCYQESQKNGKVLFVRVASNIKPFWYYNYGEAGTELFRLTWDGVEFFNFPMVEV